MYYVLDIPWGFYKPTNVKYLSNKKIYVYSGETLPESLKQFRAPLFSRGRWIEDDLNKKVSLIPKPETQFHPKPHQTEAGKKIAASYAKGWSGFLLADKTGVGKTLSALTGIGMIAKLDGKGSANRGNLLVVCPKSAIPQWRQTIRNFQAVHPLLRVVITNYQQLSKFLELPKPDPKAKKTTRRVKKGRQIAREGRPNIHFDYIVFDESHHLKNYPSSNASLMAETISGSNKVYRKGSSPFVIYSTATPGSSPLNFAMMSGFVSKLLNPQLQSYITPKLWGAFLEKEKFFVTKGKNGYIWASPPWGKKNPTAQEKASYEAALREVKAKQRKDAQRIGKALTRAGAPFIMRSPKDIAGWPEQQIIPLPIELDVKQRQIYNEAWTRFKRWLKLTPAKSDPKGALVEMLRYRQKTSLLKIDTLAEIIEDWVEQDKQVYVSFEFLETVQLLKEALEKKGIPVSEVSGRTSETREQERLRFQKGISKVVIATVVSAISFHSGETLPDGSKATPAERITILGDIRQNPLDSIQALGRAHRDGQNSIVYVPFIEDSVDKKIVDSFVNKVINTEVMTGKNVAEAEELEAIFRSDAGNG